MVYFLNFVSKGENLKPDYLRLISALVPIACKLLLVAVDFTAKHVKTETRKTVIITQKVKITGLLFMHCCVSGCIFKKSKVKRNVMVSTVTIR